MSNHIFEENPQQERSGQGSGALLKIEKQARQLLYDSRYKVKGEIKGKEVDPVNLQRMIIQKIDTSKSIPAVRARAKQMLNVKEEYFNYIEESVVDSVSKALFRVFVEDTSTDENFELSYIKEMEEKKDKKYKVRVTDKNGNSYVRYATREKITELRGNPKIQSVELTEYGEPRESEAKKGSETASALGGGKKAKKDYDGDGKIESPAKEHAGAVHNAIQRKRGLPADGQDTSSVKEEVVTEKKNFVTVGQNKRKISGEGVNNTGLIKVFPSDDTEERKNSNSVTPRSVYAHYEMDGDVISEMAKSKAQQKFFGMVHAYKKGKMKTASKNVKNVAASISDIEATKFASTKHKGLPGHVKSKNLKKESVDIDECGMGGNVIAVTQRTPEQSNPNETSDLKKINPDDPRQEYAKRAKVKNTLRSMGAKNVMVVGEAKSLPPQEKLKTDSDMFNIPKSEQEAAKQRTLEKAAAIRAKKGVTKEGREHDEPGEEDNNRDVIRHNQSLRDKKGKQLYPSGRVGRARRPDISKDPRWGSVD